MNGSECPSTRFVINSLDSLLLKYTLPVTLLFTTSASLREGIRDGCTGVRLCEAHQCCSCSVEGPCMFVIFKLLLGSRL